MYINKNLHNRIVCLVFIFLLMIPFYPTNKPFSVSAKEKTHFKKDNKKVHLRNIKWPQGCSFLAQKKDEFYFENACAEAIKSVTIWPKDCDFNFPDDLYNGNPELSSKIKFYPLSLGKYLAEFNCSSGAYNEINFYLFYDESTIPAKAELITFDSYEVGGSGSSLESVKQVKETKIFGKYFNRKTKELIMLRKYRGMGDCGEWAIYSFTNEQFMLKEYFVKTDCDGKNQIINIAKHPIGWTKIK